MKRRAHLSNWAIARCWLSRAVRLILVLAIAAVVALGGLCWQIDRAGQIDQAQPVDAIVVLGAMSNPDGSPGQDMVERTRHGVDLYRAGYAAYLLFTGGTGPSSAAQQGRSLAVALGVPPDHALAIEGAWETRGDAQTSAPILRARGWDTVLLVTHPLHCYRARHFFRQQGIQALVSPTGPVRRVPQPWRAYYTLREALGVVWPHLRLPDRWTAWLQSRMYGYGSTAFANRDKNE